MMFLRKKLIRALNIRLIGGPDEFQREARYACKIIHKWRKRHPQARLRERILHDALIDTWNDLHGFKQWRRVEVDLAVVAEMVTRRSHRVRSRKSQERPKSGWF